MKILRNAKLLDKLYAGLNRKTLRGLKDFKILICTSDYMLFVFILQKQSLGGILKNTLPEKCNIFTAKDL